MNKSIFVGNIPYGAMESEIRELFEPYGEVEEVHFVMDWQKGRFRGFGFVVMAGEAADKAIESLHGHPFQGRYLKVNEARAKHNRTHTSQDKDNGEDPGN